MYIKKLFLYLNTIKYLRFFQIYYRLRRFLPRRKPTKFNKNSFLIQAEWSKFSNNKKKELIDYNKISLLNVEGNRRDWISHSQSDLRNYHMNYFDFASDILNRQEEISVKNDIDNWIKSNTNIEEVPWDPYPTSLRIVNWIKFYLNGNEIDQNMIESIARQASYLYKNLEYDLYGNHLFRNAKALCFAGTIIQNCESKSWLSKGKKILLNEMNEQILPDGGNFELSPMYHCNMVEDMLDLLNLFRAVDPQEFGGVIEKLTGSLPKTFNWLHNMCHPDQGISFFNDSAFNGSLSLEKLNEYAELLNINSKKIDREGTFNLKESGYAVIRKKNINLICDTGFIGPDYMPGHSHADCLSFELSINNQRVFVNSGTSEYSSSSNRIFQRSTKAHNTISVDDLNSSEVWQSFRVARRAYPSATEIKENSISSSHNGFSRPPRKRIHTRQWEYSDNKLLIRDSIDGNYKRAVAHFYIHPLIDVYRHSPKHVELKYLGKFICYVDCLEDDILIKDSFWFPEFGKQEKNKSLVVNLNQGKLTTTIKLDK